VAVGLTQSWQMALEAGIAVLCVRLLEDYLILPKVLGEATGLSPLVVLFSVSAVTILFGGFAVLLAVPLAAVVATVVDVVVRGQALLIVLVGTVLSIAFAIIGLPYWILVGSFAGIVEIVPVIGPLAAGALAIGVGFTASWHTALAAGVCVFAVRMLEDYVVLPKVLGEATGLSPLVVLFSVSAITILFGGFAVLLAVPFAAVLATVVDVTLRGRNPAEEEVPTVLFPAKDAEG